ncbi:hypothetical protein ACQPW3_23630 [Actinosynnema sp. CA-248983]
MVGEGGGDPRVGLVAAGRGSFVQVEVAGQPGGARRGRQVLCRARAGCGCRSSPPITRRASDRRRGTVLLHWTTTTLDEVDAARARFDAETRR